MGPGIELAFASDVDQERFIDLVVRLGGVRQPDEWAEAQLSRGARNVWVHMDSSEPLDPEDWDTYEEKLGAALRSRIIITMSKDEGSDLLAMEIIEAAAKHWNVVIDDDYGNVLTVNELRRRAELHPVHLFTAPYPHPAPKGALGTLMRRIKGFGKSSTREER